MRRLVLCGLLLLTASARAGERFDHRGSLGLLVGAGGEYVMLSSTAVSPDFGPRVPLDVGGTLALSERLALHLGGRLSVPLLEGRPFAGALFAGLRNVHGVDRWKTFLALDLCVHVAPAFIAGLRGAFGVQYEFLPVLGAFAQLGGQLGGGQGLRLSFEASVGLQFRTYVLE